MAINVNSVYQTVLLILNKEQRGYMTPEEFNKIASQVQIEIYNKTFEDYNQLIRQQQPGPGTVDRIQNLELKLSPFRKDSYVVSVSQNTANEKYATANLPNDVYRLDKVIGNVGLDNETEIEQVTWSELFKLKLSDLTLPSDNFPIFAFEKNSGLQGGNFNKLAIMPKTVAATNTNIKLFYFARPQDVVWAYNTGSGGQYEYSVNNSIQFTLADSEFNDVVTNILLYSGIVIRDPQIVQAAAAQAQKSEIQEKN
jgi:hypothetical protein